MPHAQVTATSGFQALILCGPGVSLNTFTSSPEEYPKALVPIANRPMVWYPLDWCYRMGITDITLITPPASEKPLAAALSQNPYLTSLPSPSASIVAPPGLTLTTGTAELLRLPEVQDSIKQDFIILPCDLICDVPGESLVEAWMVRQGGLGGETGGDPLKVVGPRLVGTGGEKGGRRGGLGVWYQTTGKEESVKKEETDFVITAPLDQDEANVVPFANPDSVKARLSKLVYAKTMDSLKDQMEDDKELLIRHSLIKRHARIKMLTTYRDAHIYLLPFWVKSFAAKNTKFESFSEDLIGWWAKAGWQKGLGEKLGLREVFDDEKRRNSISMYDDGDAIEEEIDIASMSSTKIGGVPQALQSSTTSPITPVFASRVQSKADTTASSTKTSDLVIPSMIAYTHSAEAAAPLLRRVDSSALLLSVSLRLAKLPSLEEVAKADASPFAHTAKVAYPAGIAQRCTVTKGDCLLGNNTTVAEKCVIKESVIGTGCVIATGARLTRCLVMDGAIVDEKCQLTGCIIGRRSRVGKDSVLKDCEVQDGNVVPEETDAKGEKFMVFEGLEEGSEGEGFDMDVDDDAAGDDDF